MLVKSYVVGLEKSQSKLEQEESQLHVGCYQGKKRKRKESLHQVLAHIKRNFTVLSECLGFNQGYIDNEMKGGEGNY